VTQVVDVELAVKRAGGRKELAEELHNMLLDSLPALKQLIASSWESQDLDALYTHVHKLNGSTRYCGVPELESQCEALETQIKRSGNELQSGYDTLIQAIDRLLNTTADF
jgi:two-component system sensor histidine kinase BarA